ncbi:MAG: type II CAAX endopeptidase family protein [Nitrososphaerales archaeon]
MRTKLIPRFHVAIIAVSPLILNILMTPMIIISVVSLTEFLKNPTYYIYAYGFILWSVYHIFLVSLVYRFLKIEKESLKEIIGSMKAKAWLSIATIVGLLGLSILIFQVVEPIVTNLLYGPRMWEQFLTEYRRLPLAFALYGILITSLTAGVCEEIVWRGYLQTRLERIFNGRILIAITIQAILFGLWHSISLHTIFTAIFGFIFGLVYAKMRRLMPLMISHWLGDTIGFSTMYFIPIFS